MFLSLLDVIIGRELPTECSKLTCFAKIKSRHGYRAVRWMIEVGRSQSLCAYSEAEFDLGKRKNRLKATYPHSKDEDNNHHRHTNPNYHEYESESRSEADVRWLGRSTMYACRCSLHVALPTSLSWSAAGICRLKLISWVEGQCCYWQWVAEERSEERLHERQLLKKKRVLEGARRPSARTASCMRTARIAGKDVNFEAPFGGLGSFSCKRSFLLEECLLRATISVVNKDGSINLPVGRTLSTCPFFAGWASSV